MLNYSGLCNKGCFCCNHTQIKKRSSESHFRRCMFKVVQVLLSSMSVLISFSLTHTYKMTLSLVFSIYIPFPFVYHPSHSPFLPPALLLCFYSSFFPAVYLIFGFSPFIISETCPFILFSSSLLLSLPFSILLSCLFHPIYISWRTILFNYFPSLCASS